MDAIQVEDLCGFLVLDEAEVLREAGLSPSEVFQHQEPLSEVLFSKIITGLQARLPEWLADTSPACSEVRGYVMASKAEWLAGGTLVDVPLFSSPPGYGNQVLWARWKESSKVLGPWGSFSPEATDAIELSRRFFDHFHEEYFPGDSDRYGSLTCILYLVDAVGGARVPQDIPLPFLVYAGYHDTIDRPFMMERSLTVCLLLVAGPHDPQKVRSLWCEVCLASSESP
jgi:hypothetical protein